MGQPANKQQAELNHHRRRHRHERRWQHLTNKFKPPNLGSTTSATCESTRMTTGRARARPELPIVHRPESIMTNGVRRATRLTGKPRPAENVHYGAPPLGRRHSHTHTHTLTSLHELAHNVTDIVFLLPEGERERKRKRATSLQDC